MYLIKQIKIKLNNKRKNKNKKNYNFKLPNYILQTIIKTI